MIQILQSETKISCFYCTTLYYKINLIYSKMYISSSQYFYIYSLFRKVQPHT